MRALCIPSGQPRHDSRVGARVRQSSHMLRGVGISPSAMGRAREHHCCVLLTHATLHAHPPACPQRAGRPAAAPLARPALAGWPYIHPADIPLGLGTRRACVCCGDTPESTIEGRGLEWEHPHHREVATVAKDNYSSTRTEMQRIRFSQRTIVMLGGPLIVDFRRLA